MVRAREAFVIASSSIREHLLDLAPRPCLGVGNDARQRRRERCLQHRCAADAAELGVDRDAPAHEARRPFAHRAFRRRRFEHRRHAGEVAASGDAEEVFEVVEVDVDRPQGDPGPGGDLPGGRAQAAFPQEVEERVGDCVACVAALRAARPSTTGAVTSAQCTYTARRVQRRSCPGAVKHEIAAPLRTPPRSLPAMPHPDLASERARLEFAQECLDGMRKRTADRVRNEAVLAANKADAEAVKWQLQRRLASLDDEAAVLAFGRIDEERGDQWYIGRRHVEDERGTPVVVDWRAEVATPFYRATLADPFGLEKRRRFVFTGRELTDLFEEDFDDPDSMVGSGGVPDPLLAELGRARTGQMRDIVSTIQAEQDAIIRAPLESCLVVQGGPGTGKTAVGLHRAAFLLYEHRTLLSREGVLVVGPNPVFLRYISQVLPSLGETSATQTTVERVARTALPIARRRRPRRRGGQGRRADGNRRRTGRRERDQDPRRRRTAALPEPVARTLGRRAPRARARRRAAEARRSPRNANDFARNSCVVHTRCSRAGK